MKVATISTHVLDTARGEPVAGVRVMVTATADDAVREGTTGPDGRFRFEEPVPLGGYLLHFDISDHVLSGAHLFQTVEFLVRLEEERHYHIPLLISPFGVSCYRGS
jgi:5-hydroxyisourate hydrolase